MLFDVKQGFYHKFLSYVIACSYVHNETKSVMSNMVQLKGNLTHARESQVEKSHVELHHASQTDVGTCNIPHLYQAA